MEFRFAELKAIGFSFAGWKGYDWGYAGVTCVMLFASDRDKYARRGAALSLSLGPPPKKNTITLPLQPRKIRVSVSLKPKSVVDRALPLLRQECG